MKEFCRLTRADALGLGLVITLMGVCVPMVVAQQTQRTRDSANRSQCAANIRGITQSMLVYAAEQQDQLPYVGGNSATAYHVNFVPDESVTGGPQALQAMYKDERFFNDPYAPLWVMVLLGQLAPKQFQCKSDPFIVSPSNASDGQNFHLGFQYAGGVSYSVAYMWAQDAGGKAIQAPRWISQTDATLPLISDMAPCLNDGGITVDSADMQKQSESWLLKNAVSPNHTGFDHELDGQNVGYGDGHAEYERKPTVGQNEESIWGQRVLLEGIQREVIIEPGMLRAPQIGEPGNFDTIMVPTRAANGKLK